MLKKRLRANLFVLGLTAWAAATIILTILPGDNVILRAMFRLMNHIRHIDAMLHTALFASLTVVFWLLLRHWIKSRHMLLVAMALALLTGTLTELEQTNVAHRSVTVSDMMGNWLGVFAAGFVLSYFSVGRDAIHRRDLF